MLKVGFAMHGMVVRVCVVAAVLFAIPLRAAGNLESSAEPAPDFALKSMTGENLRLSEYRGEVVVLNFWSSDCGTCVLQMPAVQKLYEQYRDNGLQVLGINIDRNPRKAWEMVEKLDLTYPVLFDAEKSVSREYKLNALPVVVVIDRSGAIRYTHSKYRSADRHEYRREIDELLAE
jgi:peroxiredoxin